MAAPKENSLFPLDPYYIPGYEGFVPQLKYQFGETYGKATYRLLTDPDVQRSPHSLLAPVQKQKFIEDFSDIKDGIGAQHHLPRRPGYFPFERDGVATSYPKAVLAPKPLLPRPGMAEEELVLRHMDPVPEHHMSDYVPARLPRGYPGTFSCHPAAEEQKRRLPVITPAGGQRRGAGPGQLSHALGATKPHASIEGVTLPEVPKTRDVEQDNWLPQLDVPNAIKQKVITGYAGFIPRLAWVYGVGYLQAVKEALEEFDQQQFLQRTPPSSFGKRFPPTYWPNNIIYSSAGLIPFYAGFVPQLRHTYALTYGNSTRKAYEKEQRRRACAL